LIVISSRQTACFFRVKIWVLLCVCLFLWFGLEEDAQASLNQELIRAEKQLQLLENKTGLIRHEYLQFEDKETSLKKFEHRLNDGQAMMLLKDYVRAATVFYDLVDEKYKDHPKYLDAMFSLGEALFFNDNYIDARKFFAAVIKYDSGKPFEKLAMVRLMQIALNTNDYSVIDDMYGRLKRKSTGLYPEAEYLWGKTLFHRGRYAEAAKSFSVLRPGDVFYFQARYFLAVVLIREKKVDQALDVFATIISTPPKYEKDKTVVELSYLARGRLLHDLGREAEALDAYQAVEYTSAFFDDALFEICWTYIKRADRSEQPDERDAWLLEAQRTLEILEVSTPNSRLVPKAKLLKGHILEKRGKYDEAADAFLNVAKTYVGVKQQLDDLISSHDDPVRYFNEVAGKNLDSFDLSSYLPPLAVRWMSSQDEINAALGVMKDIETGRKFVSEAQAMLEKIITLLKDANRVNLFPALREGVQRTLEVENGRMILERNLARLEERIVLEHVSGKERKAIEEARNNRMRLEKMINELPVTQKDFESREKSARGKIELMEKAVYESGIALKGMKAQLSAMEEWVRQHEDQLAGREEAVRDFREEIRRGWATANQLQAELDDLTNMLSTEKARAGMDSEVLSGEEELRRQYTQSLNRERMLAEQIHSRLGPTGTTQISKINKMRLRVDKLRRTLEQVKKELNAKVDKKAEKLRAEVEQEQRHLMSFEKSLDQLESESTNLAGGVAFKALQDVRQRFYHLVLEADVGLLDIAWGKKQEKTRKITELGKQLGSDRKRLHQEFKSVLKEVQ
jgi:TolA-binding protein